VSLLNDQRRLCQDLALEARHAHAEIETARVEFMLRLRREISSPIGLLGFFAAGFATGLLLSAAGRREKGAAEDGRRGALSRGRRAAATGLWLLRMIEAIGR
jgi:hypothetical protein